jgi:phosphoglucosamine mutase
MFNVEFGADGIRGIVGQGFLHPANLVRVGQALGRFVCYHHSEHPPEHPFVMIGRDTRASGANILHCLTAGLTDQGVNVTDLGVMTTPGVAFITRRLQADLGVIVSASHNPIDYNGIKLVRQNGLRLQREDEIEIEMLASKFASEIAQSASTLGQQSDGQHLVELYIQGHVDHHPTMLLAGLRLALDCADGAASRVAPEVFRRLGAEVVVINDAIEGKSINYRCGTEYVREHPQDLVKVMRQFDAVYGFAFDGDGDRLVVVDRNGRIFDGHDFLFVLAKYFHSKDRLTHDTVVTIHQANRGLEEALDPEIQTMYVNNGDRYIETALWGNDYLLGGEPGGNIIINDGYHTAADAVNTGVALAEVLVGDRSIDLCARTSPLRKYPQVITTLEIQDVLTSEQKMALQEQIMHKQEELGEDSRIMFWDSSTEPGIVRLLVEGGQESTFEEVSKMADVVCRMIKQVATTSEEITSLPIITGQNLALPC